MIGRLANKGGIYGCDAIAALQESPEWAREFTYQLGSENQRQDGSSAHLYAWRYCFFSS